MIYRIATDRDVTALQELGLAAYGRFKKDMSELNWKKMFRVLTAEETFPSMVRQCYAFVCEENAVLTGMAFLVPGGNPTAIYASDTSYIRMVGVHPNAGGKGIAQHLTKLCIDKAVDTGEKKISLHSAEIMYAARHIYEKLGFRKIKLLDEHYGLAYWLYEMSLTN